MYKGVKASYRPIRLYSTGGGEEKQVFLSNLLARIENMNLKKKAPSPEPIVKSKSTKTDKSTANAGPRRNTKANAKTESKSVPSVQGSAEKIKVADHPLFRARLNRVARPEGRPRPTGPRPTNTNFKANSNTKPTNNARKTSFKPRAPRALTKASESLALVSKEVKAQDFNPSLTNHFLYGKSTNFQINLTSRITSLVKNQLIKSKYPYLVPRSVINSIAPNKDTNKFLVSDDYSLEIDPEELKQNVDTVILGKPQNLPGSSHLIDNLNKNPTLSLAQKSTMSDIINSKDFSTVFSNAHWKL